ncbi:MAG TPA: glycosyltransferase [Candidatus Bathyarchaeia archaeon]|nr:glycosyltransferase [Candidatus Bathyarchaeia archaeon]
MLTKVKDYATEHHELDTHDDRIVEPSRNSTRMTIRTVRLLPKRVLIIGHRSEIYGPVQALVNFSEKNFSEVSVILHPLPQSRIDSTTYRTFNEGKATYSSSKRIFGRSEMLCFIQHVFWAFFLVITKTNGRFDLCVGIDNLNAFCAIMLRKLGLVSDVVFYVIDYTPRRFRNPVKNVSYHWLDQLCVKHAGRVWNLSDRMAEVRMRQGVDNERNLVVPVGVELEKVKFAPASDIDRNRLVFVSHLTRSKGGELLISAMKDLQDRGIYAKLDIIGTGPFEQHLRELVAKANLGERIEFLGLVRHDELLRYLSMYGIAVAPYMEDPDSITYLADPTKPKEYLACGLPVIITRVPWIAKEIERREMGIAIKYDKQELVDAIIRLLQDEEFYQRCRTNAEAFSARLGWDSVFESAFHKSISRMFATEPR